MTPQPTYIELKNRIMAMPLEIEVKKQLLSVIVGCAALGLTPNQCLDLIESKMDTQEQPKPIENGGNGYHKNYSEFLEDGASVLWFKKEKGNCCDGFTDLISVHCKN